MNKNDICHAAHQGGSSALKVLTDSSNLLTAFTTMYESVCVCVEVWMWQRSPPACQEGNNTHTARLRLQEQFTCWASDLTLWEQEFQLFDGCSCLEVKLHLWVQFWWTWTGVDPPQHPHRWRPYWMILQYLCYVQVSFTAVYLHSGHHISSFWEQVKLILPLMLSTFCDVIWSRRIRAEISKFWCQPAYVLLQQERTDLIWRVTWGQRDSMCLNKHTSCMCQCASVSEGGWPSGTWGSCWVSSPFVLSSSPRL